MDLKEIMSVSGQGGLFKFVSQARNGVIVESFADSKRSFVSASTKISSLEEIAVFAVEKEVPLKEILKTIHSLEPEVAVPDPGSSADALKEFMEKVLPEYDRNRVYVSDIKKIVSWYGTLKANGLLEFEETEAETEPDTSSESSHDSDSNSDSDSDLSKGKKEEDTGSGKVKKEKDSGSEKAKKKDGD